MLYRKLFTLFNCVTLFVIAGSAIAAPSPAPNYNLTLELRAPTWSSRDGYISNGNATEFGGSLKLNNVIGDLPCLSFTLAGRHALGDFNTIFDAKNELQAGIEYKLGHETTFFSYFDRHFNADVDRVFVGVRYNTSGAF